MKAHEPKAGGRKPVHILSGFLGSGKTTILRSILADPAFADTAVIVNEFGEVGLDHHLLRGVASDVVLLDRGCLCCAVRGDLVSTLASLAGLAAAGEIPDFARAVVETSGVADPIPICEAVLSDRRLGAYTLGAVATAVDAVEVGRALDPVAATQVAAADRLVITKADLASEAEIAELRTRLHSLNAAAPILVSGIGKPVSGAGIFDGAVGGRRHFAALTLPADPVRHAGIATFTVALDRPVDWGQFVRWLELLLAARGETILRIKGFLAVDGQSLPLAIQCVRHVIHQPRPLDHWPAGIGESRLVFIVNDLTKTAVERSLADDLGVQLPLS